MTVIGTAYGDITIRELISITDMEMAEQIQVRVWGVETLPCPKEMLIPVQHEGGLLAGAFAGDEMVGLVFSFPTRDPETHHSQLLATSEEWRGLGIGTALKWYQRDWCLGHGIRMIRWTVDPLRSANADLNVRHLGGTARTYSIDYYGKMQGIDAGAPTDRLLVEWQLNSPRVIARSHGKIADQGFPGVDCANEVQDGWPVQNKIDLESARILIRLPVDFVKIAQTQPDMALAWRLTTRELFLNYFRRGYVITEYTRAGGPAYFLTVQGSV